MQAVTLVREKDPRGRLFALAGSFRARPNVEIAALGQRHVQDPSELRRALGCGLFIPERLGEWLVQVQYDFPPAAWEVIEREVGRWRERVEHGLPPSGLELA